MRQNNLTSHLERQIMRRVYIAYVLTIVVGGLGRSAFWYGVIAAFTVAIFRAEVHVMSIYHNVLAVPLGDIPGYINDTFTNAITAGELLKVGSVIVLGYVTLWTIKQFWQFFSVFITTQSRQSSRYS